MHSPALSAPALSVRQTAAADVDAHTAQLGDWDLRYDQLDCGAFQGRFTDVRWPGVQLFAEETTRRVHQRGSLPANSIALACPLTDGSDVFVDGRREAAGVAVALHAAEVDICTPAGCILAGVVFDAELLDDAIAPAAQIARTLAEQRMLALRLAPADAAGLRTLLRAAVAAALKGVSGATAQHHLRDELLLKALEILARADVAQADTPPGLRKRVVDRARDLLLADAAEPPSLLEVSKQVGVSPRKLAYCFEHVLGMSPARYLKLLRLNAARRELRSMDPCETSVYDVAARWGFWHFGHFSADYKRMFAELPSETLRGVRGAALTPAAPAPAGTATMGGPPRLPPCPSTETVARQVPQESHTRVPKHGA